MTEKEFFKHDITALGDRQLKKLVRENSCCGYAVFFAALDFMYQEDGESINLKDLVLDVAEGLYTSEEIAEKVIKSCVELGLFSTDENGIYSRRVRLAIAERELDREKYRNMANKRWKKDSDAEANAQADAQAMPTHMHRQCKKEKEEEKEEEKKKEEEYISTPTPKKKLSHPSLEEVRAYCLERKNSVDPEAFIDYYSSQNWKKANGEPLTDWKAGVRTWERKEKEKSPAPQFGRKMVEDLEERRRLNASIDPRTGKPRSVV